MSVFARHIAGKKKLVLTRQGFFWGVDRHYSRELFFQDTSVPTKGILVCHMSAMLMLALCLFVLSSLESHQH